MIKRELRSKAHRLKPVVIIGDKGLTKTVLTEINRALFDHELIKVKIVISEKEEFSQITQSICTTLHVELIQSIGCIIVLYRKSNKKDGKVKK